MINCIVCNNKHFTPLYNGLLMKCDTCNFVTANSNFNFVDIKKIYSDEYFNGSEYLNYLEDKSGLQYNFMNRINAIAKNATNPGINNCLEIGCAYGFFGEVLLSRFPSINYKGIDIASDAIEKGRKLFNINLEEIDYLELKTEQKYSDIFMWDVIEHLPHPEKFIEKSAMEIERGGRLYITTGDIDALLPKLQKSKWRMIHPPSHLHYFSKNTLIKLLENYGFQVKSVRYPSIWRSIKQIHYSLFLLNKSSAFHSTVNKLIPNKLYFPLNTFDIMFVTAIKK